MKILELSRSHKLLLMSAVVAFSIFGGTVITPLSTALAVTCSGYGCDHLEPTATGCASGAVTKKTAYISIPWGTGTKNIGKVELRYSSLCDTAWSRMTIVDTYAVPGDPYTSTVSVIRRNMQDDTEPAVYDTRTDRGLLYLDQNWSHQLYIPYSSSDPYSIRACGTLTREVNGQQFGPACTSYWTGV